MFAWGCLVRGCLPGGVCLGVSAQGCLPGGVWLGVSAWGGVCLGVFAWGCLARWCLPWGCLPWGCLPWGCLPWGCLPRGVFMGGGMPKDKIIDRCLYITFQQLLLPEVTSRIQSTIHVKPWPHWVSLSAKVMFLQVAVCLSTGRGEVRPEVSVLRVVCVQVDSLSRGYLCLPPPPPRMVMRRLYPSYCSAFLLQTFPYTIAVKMWTLQLVTMVTTFAVLFRWPSLERSDRIGSPEGW